MPRNLDVPCKSTGSLEEAFSVLKKGLDLLLLLLLLLLLTAIGFSPGGSGYFTCKQTTKLVTTKFKGYMRSM